MITFDLLNTPAEADILNTDEDYGVLVVKNNIPQVFIPLPQDSVDNWESVIRIDPENIEEVKKTTDVYFGMIDADLVFLVERKLF